MINYQSSHIIFEFELQHPIFQQYHY